MIPEWLYWVCGPEPKSVFILVRKGKVWSGTGTTMHGWCRNRRFAHLYTNERTGSYSLGETLSQALGAGMKTVGYRIPLYD